jgi:biopolymer transport protein ExbB
MLDWLVKGGPVMVPILGGSILALAIFFERLWALRRERVVPDTFLARIDELVAKGDHPAALRACRDADNPMAHVLAAALAEPTRPRAEMREAVEEVGKVQGAGLERWVEAVGTIAAIEPLMGLLGTVFGMISVFQKVEELGLGDPSGFAAGIWQALITTAAGLTIGIPALIGYRYLLARVERLLLEMEERTFAVVEALTRKRGQ